MINPQGFGKLDVTFAVATELRPVRDDWSDLIQLAAWSTLDFWDTNTLPTTSSNAAIRAACREHVQRLMEVRRPGLFKNPIAYITWPWRMNAMVRDVVHELYFWLESRRSLEWRQAQLKGRLK
jgi:hypothetical protein